MKKISLLTILFCFLLFNKVFAEELKNPSALFKKMQEAYKNINSYSYTNYQGEFDIFSKEYQKETAKNYGDLNSKYGDGKKTEVSDKPEYKTGTYQVSFFKPYSIKMKIISSDYTPSVLNNAEFIYRPDRDPKNFTIKIMGLGFIPLEFQRSVVEENTGDFLVMNWAVDLMQISYYFLNGKPEIKKDKIGDKNTYLMEFKFPENIKPTTPSYELGDIPAQAKKKIDYTLGSLDRAKYSSVKYWIDDKDFVIVKREEYIGGKLHSSRIFKNISLNSVSKGDI